MLYVVCFIMNNIKSPYFIKKYYICIEFIKKKIPIIYLWLIKFKSTSCNFNGHIFFLYGCITIVYSATPGLYNDLRCPGKPT